MKNISTLRCKLFGHLLVEKRWVPYKHTNVELAAFMKSGEYMKFDVDNCVRCGIKREEL